MKTYPRETKEIVPVTVTVNGTPVDPGELEVTVQPEGERPTGWTAPLVVDQTVGVLIENLAPGGYTVWARVLGSAPEQPVLELGTFRVT